MGGPPRLQHFARLDVRVAVHGLVNIGVDGWFDRRNTRPVAESARVLVNALGFMVNGHITGWLHVLWFYVPFCLLWYSAADRPECCMRSSRIASSSTLPTSGPWNRRSSPAWG